MDRAGRIVVPQRVRRAAGLEPGIGLLASFRDGRIELEPLPREVRLEQRGPVWVAVPAEESEPLTAEVVAETTGALRRERGGG